MKKNIEDILFFVGMLLILIPTFLLNVYIGCYLTGLVLLAGSFLWTTKKGEKEE